MKKKVILSIAVVLLVVMVAMMATACSITPEKLKEKLEKKGYDVRDCSAEEIISIVANLDKNDDDQKFFTHALFNYEEKEKQFVVYDNKNLTNVFVVYGKKDSTKPLLLVFWYKDKDTAKKAQSQALTNYSDNIISGDAFTSGEIASGATDSLKEKAIMQKGNALVIGDAEIAKSL